MTGRRLRLHHRIVIPIALVTLLTTAVTAYTALIVTASALRTRLESQIVNAAELLSQGDFGLNPAIIRSARAITGADIVTYSTSGEILATTLDRSAAAAIVAAVRGHAAGAPRGTSGSAILIEDAECGVRPCTIAYQPISSRADIHVAVVTSTEELQAATDTVTGAILLAAVLSLVVMLAVGQFAARRVTRPLEALVRFTNDVAGGDTSQRAQEDSTEVGTLAAAFNAMLHRLEQSVRAQVRSEKLALAGLFAARVAHDIRNPLASIKMQTDVLRARLRDADAPTVSALDAVQRDVLQVNSVVGDLLELSRPGTLSPHPVSLDKVVTETIDQVAPQLAYRKVAVEPRLGTAGVTVHLDAARFKQALLNIINNASDAMPTGGTLTIATVSEGVSVRLDVCDDGEGVEPSVLPRVFDPFVSTKRDGMGLGLVNAKAVVESHGGTIELAPRSPRGTCVTVRMPCRAVHHG